ncbi:MAG: hypothetical protein EPO21_12080 [Chloroflexota bacterium]|nr:MAG: hypothetical protein EPO21_12080 [Chloroflexota bacterium]
MTTRVDRMQRTAILAPTKQTQSLEQEQYVKRFDVHQRIQHILMFTTFLTLAFTGLPQKTSMFGVSAWIITSLGGLEIVQLVHRIAAVTMLFDGVYHITYLTYGVLIGRKLQPLAMIPMPKDLRDGIQMFLYYFGLVHERPKFGKFSYLEKFDYWAVFWGIAIIGGSGLVLMFPVEASKVFGGGVIPIALTAHSDEALLAVGWIFIVHFFYVHLAPAVFPFNSSIFTGKVPLHRYKEEHPLDYERMQRVAVRKAIQTEPEKADTTGKEQQPAAMAASQTDPLPPSPQAASSQPDEGNPASAPGGQALGAGEGKEAPARQEHHSEGKEPG